MSPPLLQILKTVAIALVETLASFIVSSLDKFNGKNSKQ